MAINSQISEQQPLVAFAKYLLSLRNELHKEEAMPTVAFNTTDTTTDTSKVRAA